MLSGCSNLQGGIVAELEDFVAQFSQPIINAVVEARRQSSRLTYQVSGQFISDEDLARLLKMIGERVAAELQRLESEKLEHVVTKATSNTSYLALVAAMQRPAPKPPPPPPQAPPR